MQCPVPLGDRPCHLRVAQIPFLAQPVIAGCIHIGQQYGVLRAAQQRQGGYPQLGQHQIAADFPCILFLLKDLQDVPFPLRFHPIQRDAGL